MISKWDNRFLDMAKFISSWSKDPSTKVGAVITNNKNRIVSLGFNGYPRGIKDEGLEDREIKYQKIIHAERNAILFANKDLTNHNIYLYPFLPCSSCMAMIIQAGITKVVVKLKTNNELTARWADSNKIALDTANEAGIEIEVVR